MKICRSNHEFLPGNGDTNGQGNGNTGGSGKGVDKSEFLLRGDMTDEDMLMFAYNLAERTLLKENLGWSMAAYQTVIGMTEKYGGQWQAIVVTRQNSLGYYIQRVPGTYAEFKLGTFVFMIWNSEP